MPDRKDEPVDFAFVLASSVHDMKNSLGMLLNTLSEVMIKFPAQSQEQERSYAVLEYEASRINSELVQLLSLYRLEQDQIHIHIDQYLVKDMLEEQLARNIDLFSSRKITVELDCPDDLHGYFDVDLLGSVVNNILVNASRYSHERIRLSASPLAAGFKISIEDDGSGFPPAMLSPETWGASRSSFVAGRPHLGLMFASRIAKMHNNRGVRGEIELSNNSDLGGGRFSISLP